MTKFGPAGIPLSCTGNNIEGLKYSMKLGLEAYEVEFVRGARMNPLMAKEIQKERGTTRISCHAPYFINCSNIEKYNITERNLIEPIKINKDLPFTRIVFHVGYRSGSEKPLKTSIEVIKRVIEKAYSKGLKDFTLGPEIAGKKSQIGTTEELIELCKEVKEAKPVIDWAHLHAVSNGGLKTTKDFMKPLELIENELGKDYLKELHCHYSNIRYGLKGEINHEPLDSEWGPDFKILARVIKENGYDFTIISESPLIEKDALKMQDILQHI